MSFCPSLIADFLKPRMDADTHEFKFCFYPCSSAFIRGLFFVRFSIEKLYTSDKRCLKAVIVAFCSAKVAFFNRGSNLALAIADFFETTDGRGYTRIQVLFYPCSSAFIRGLFFVRFSIEKLHTSDKPVSYTHLTLPTIYSV